jgi:hypothetical protein
VVRSKTNLRFRENIGIIHEIQYIFGCRTCHEIHSQDGLGGVCPGSRRDLCKTSPFAQSLRQTQISILKILKVFLWLKSSPSLTLNKIECYAKVSRNAVPESNGVRIKRWGPTAIEPQKQVLTPLSRSIGTAGSFNLYLSYCA